MPRTLVRLAARLKEGRVERHFRRGSEVRHRRSMFATLKGGHVSELNSAQIEQFAAAGFLWHPASTGSGFWQRSV